MKTYIPKVSEIQKKWYVVDVADENFGRQINKIARILMGKTKPMYTPHLDCGDYVIIVNAGKVKISGKKMTEEILQLFRLSGRALRAHIRADA